MDLFNKKKLEDMTIHLAEVMQDRNKWEKAYTNQVKDTNKLLEENKNLIQENQKLIDWIEKILNEVGIKTKDSYEVQTITIPYYEEIKPYCIEGDWDKASMKQRDIIIPSIKYTKINQESDFKEKTKCKEVKMNNKTNAEEDIKFIEKMIKEYKTFSDLANVEFEDTEKIYKAIENILADRERIKEENKNLEANNYEQNNIINSYIEREQKIIEKLEEDIENSDRGMDTNIILIKEYYKNKKEYAQEILKLVKGEKK